MSNLKDYQNRSIRLTEERLLHILSHPEMKGFELQIESVLQNPQVVRLSKTDNSVQLYYRYYEKTIVGAKWLCVVVKHTPNDSFVITAYLTNRVKKGVELWHNL
ncbi:MAG: hypothetical protein ACLFTJ_12115 [Halothece sp.]